MFGRFEVRFLERIHLIFGRTFINIVSCNFYLNWNIGSWSSNFGKFRFDSTLVVMSSAPSDPYPCPRGAYWLLLYLLSGGSSIPKVFKEVIVHLTYAYYGGRENQEFLLGIQRIAKWVWFVGMAQSIQFFFSFFRSYLDILLLIFVMSQNLRLVSILKKAYALSTWNRILSTFYYDYIYIWLVYILNTKILRKFWIFLFRIGKHYSVTSKKSLLIIHLFIHFQLIII